jgi:hypothetical protein
MALTLRSVFSWARVASTGAKRNAVRRLSGQGRVAHYPRSQGRPHRQKFPFGRALDKAIFELKQSDRHPVAQFGTATPRAPFSARPLFGIGHQASKYT